MISTSTIWLILYFLAYIAVLIRVLAVRDKDPSARAAWILVLLFIPGLGIVAYLLFGEPWVGRRSRRKAGTIEADLLACVPMDVTSTVAKVPDRFQSVFRTCEYLSDCPAVDHNQALLTDDADDAIDSMIDDFENAEESIHVSFYIWLKDHNGRKVVEALKRAAERGVTCRVIADGIGSRALIRSRYWRQMRKAGVKVCKSMKVTPGFIVALGNRVDLRNHRKIVVIDNKVTYCGSQNCADAEFLVKQKFAPWVDIWLRFEGPVAVQNQRLFASDWLIEYGENLGEMLRRPIPAQQPANGFVAIAFGTGPTFPKDAMLNVFVNLLHCAEKEVVITNPYFVPSVSLMQALINCARRGVKTTMVLPARNDSWLVGVISRALYAPLLKSGVHIHEYEPGLLHAKTLVVDEEVSLVGSSNMDRRSLELNFENNILLCSKDLSRQIRQRQDEWLEDTRVVSRETVENRSLLHRIGDNLAAMFGPVM